MPISGPTAQGDSRKRARSPGDEREDPNAGSACSVRIKQEQAPLDEIAKQSAKPAFDSAQELDKRVEALEAQWKASSIRPELVRGIYQQAVTAARAEASAVTAETNRRLNAVEALTAGTRAEQRRLDLLSHELLTNLAQQQARIVRLEESVHASSGRSTAQVTRTHSVHVNPSMSRMGATYPTSIGRPTAETNSQVGGRVRTAREIAGCSITTGARQMLKELENDSRTRKDLTDSIDAFLLKVETVMRTLADEAIDRRYPTQQRSVDASVNSSALSQQTELHPSSSTSAPSNSSRPPA